MGSGATDPELGLALRSRWGHRDFSPLADQCTSLAAHRLETVRRLPSAQRLVFRTLIVLSPLRLADSDQYPAGYTSSSGGLSPGPLAGTSSDTPLGTLQVVTTVSGLPILLVVTIMIASTRTTSSGVADVR